MKSWVPFFYFCKLFTGSSEASSFSDSPSNAWGISLVCAWLVRGRARGCWWVGRCGSFSLPLSSVSCKAVGKVLWCSVRKGGAQQFLAERCTQVPQGAHCYVTNVLERPRVEYFSSSLRKFFQALDWNRVDTVLRMPSQQCLNWLELRPCPCWLTIFEMKAVSVPRVEKELWNRETVRLCFMIMALLPWSYRKVFRLCFSKQELICQKHLAWAHWLSSSPQILIFWSAHAASPVCGSTFSIIGREYLLILWRTDPLCDPSKRPNIQ